MATMPAPSRPAAIHGQAARSTVGSSPQSSTGNCASARFGTAIRWNSGQAASGLNSP